MEENKQQQPQEGKNKPAHVSGSNEEKTKEKTEPLNEDATQLKDQQEGRMKNGELGSGLRSSD